MRYYVLLTVSTLLIALLAGSIWRRTRQIGFVFGILCLYFWSLFGAWTVVTEKMFGGETEQFAYLYYKMFPVYLDDDYFLSLALYAVFILTVELTVLLLARDTEQTEAPASNAVWVTHSRILFLGCFCGLLAYLIVRNSISMAATESTSAYGYVRNDPAVAPLYGLHLILNRAALAPLFLGMSIVLSGNRARFIRGQSNALIVLGYVASIGAMFALNFLLGNRSILVFMFVLMALFYLANTTRPSWGLLTGLSALGGITLIAVKLYRDGILSTSLGGSGLLEMLSVAKQEIFTGTEAFASHFSMYGTLANHVSPTYGESFLFLVASFVPSAIWHDKPASSYEHYAAGVGLVEGQGYTIHHATGWFINFALPGLIVGAVLFGLVWAGLHNWLQREHAFRSHMGHLFVILGFCNFTAYIPTLLRSGPEAYRSLAIEGLLVPFLVLSLATVSLVKIQNRLRIAPNRAVRATPYRPTLWTLRNHQ